MSIYKVNDNYYVNLDLITEIYWHSQNNSWVLSLVGQLGEFSNRLTEDEKNKLVAVMQAHSRNS